MTNKEVILALENFLERKFPCEECGNPHKPYRPTPKDGLWWDKEGHVYRRISGDQYIKNLIKKLKG